MFSGMSAKEREIRDDYRTVFSSAKGRKVLQDILTELGFFDELVESPENLVSQNNARMILKKCGVLTEGNLSRLVDSLMVGGS